MGVKIEQSDSSETVPAHEFITHIVWDKPLPTGTVKKQVIPVCSSANDYANGYFFVGYNGSRRLTLQRLEDPAIVALPEMPKIKKHCTVWIDADKKVYYRNVLDRDVWEHIATITD